MQEFERALRDYAANGASQDGHLRSAAEARLQAARDLAHAAGAFEPDREELSPQESLQRP